MTSRDFMIVSAIDFGTTYSGYAYSMRSDYKQDPLRIFTNAQWPNDGDGTFKTPTSILFDKNKKFDSFGYVAERKYASLAARAEDTDDDEDESEDEEEPREDHREWYFFRRFKMTLFRAINQFNTQRRKRITENMVLKSESGKTLPALNVFSEAIRYLKNHLDDVLAKKLMSEEYPGKMKQKSSWADDVKWVLTVPAIWSNEAKMFMRVAAEKAGISGNQLLLALEPEAAAVFCKQISLQKGNEEEEVQVFQPGKKFVVVDCGGGTVDVTAHGVEADGSLRELHCATGDAIGGTNVDRKFFGFLEDTLGADSVKEFKDNNSSDWFELERSFEAKKRNIAHDEEQSEHITFSNLQALCQHYKARNDKDCKTRISELGLQKKIKVFKETKFRFSSDYLKEIAFSDPVQSIVRHLIELFSKSKISNIDTILLVGGFSECPILQREIRKHFSNKNVLTPSEANLAVLKGAVIFGHDSQNISTRLSPKHYGIATNVPFQNEKHPLAHRVLVDDKYVCTDVFKCMIQRNTPLKVVEHTFTPSSENDSIANIEIYESHTQQIPQYCNDDGCRMLGQITVPIDRLQTVPSDEKRNIKVQLHFEGTELTVTGTDITTGESARAKFECLKR